MSRPESVGGASLPRCITTMAFLYLMAGNGGAAGYALLTAGSAHLIESFGSEELKQVYMRRMYAGEWTGTMALTEPHADLQPDLNITPSNDVKTVAAAVSPESSYRLVKETIDAAREDVRLYIYHVDANHMIELLRDAESRGVRIRVMCEATQNNEGEQQR